MGRNAITAEKLHGVCEALLLPLASRYLETQRSDTAFRDDVAIDFVNNLEFDVEAFKGDKLNVTGVVARTQVLDAAVSRFLEQNAAPLVVNLGAGLCTRYWRLGAAEKDVTWCDVDLRPVIDTRRALLNRCDVPTRGYQSIARDVRKPGCLDSLSTDRHQPRLIIAEGLCMYLREMEVRDLMFRLSEHLPSAEILIESWSPFVTSVWGKFSPSLRRIGAQLQWSLRDARDFESWTGGFKVVDSYRPGELLPHRWGLLRFLPIIRRHFTQITHLKHDVNRGLRIAGEAA